MTGKSALGVPGAQLAHVHKTRGKDESTRREAYSPAEFAVKFGRNPSWAYRLLYRGKVKALPDLGRILIPASELERVLSSAAPYNPKPRKPKTPPAESGAMIGRDT
jgi:hypothetical protein